MLNSTRLFLLFLTNLKNKKTTTEIQRMNELEIYSVVLVVAIAAAFAFLSIIYRIFQAEETTMFLFYSFTEYYVLLNFFVEKKQNI